MLIKKIQLMMVLVALGVAGHASAARLFLTTNRPTPDWHELVQIDVMIEPTEIAINALAGVIVLPPSVKVEAVKAGDSVVGLWVKPPQAEGQTIVFSGIIPGGFQGVLGPYWSGYHPGKLFSFLVRPATAGATAITWQEAHVFLHDGQGSETTATRSPLTLTVGATAAGRDAPLPEDVTPPEPFQPQIGQDPSLFDGKYFVVFNAVDKESGVARYEVNGVVAQSPYVLPDQSLRGPVKVKAIDRAGNERVASVGARLSPPAWYEKWPTSAILFVAFVCLVILIFYWV